MVELVKSAGGDASSDSGAAPPDSESRDQLAMQAFSRISSDAATLRELLLAILEEAPNESVSKAGALAVAADVMLQRVGWVADAVLRHGYGETPNTGGAVNWFAADYLGDAMKKVGVAS